MSDPKIDRCQFRKSRWSLPRPEEATFIDVSGDVCGLWIGRVADSDTWFVLGRPLFDQPEKFPAKSRDEAVEKALKVARKRLDQLAKEHALLTKLVKAAADAWKEREPQ